MLQGGGGYHLDSGWEGGRTRNVFAMASFYYSELLKLETEYGVFDLRTYVFFFLPQFYLNSPDRMLLFKGHTTLAQ